MHKLILASLMIISFVCSKGGNKTGSDLNTDSNNTTGVAPDELESWQTVLETGEKMDWVFGKNYKPYSPTAGEIDQAEELLKQCFTKQVSGTVNRFNGKKLEDYNRQFLGGITESGEKVIWINCLCKREVEAFKDWKTRLIIVADGGNCFFNVKVNINKQVYYDLMINGNA